jgi:AbiV family abortive infection protein
MTDAQTLKFLMRGGWLALEQGGRLIRDAEILFKAGSHSSAVALALLSREEVAKAKMLFDLWICASRVETISQEMVLRKIRALNHIRKQRLAATSFSAPLDVERISGGGPLEEILKYFDEVAGARARRREQALYVDPLSDHLEWRRPADIEPAEAETIIADARMDYWQQYSCPGLPGWARDLERLRAALAEWVDKPPLHRVDP